MKCPKCGYLGFETTDRCRNCQYDFSLAPFAADPDLALQPADRAEANADFDLPVIKKQADKLGANALDLDRLFGEEVAAESRVSMTAPAIEILDEDVAPPPAVEPAIEESAFAREDLERRRDQLVEPVESLEPVEPDSALPFDDAPIVPPPAARPPLAVRRATPEVPRNRPRTTRPVKLTPLQLEADPEAVRPGMFGSASDTVAALMEAPPLSARVGAGAIDTLLLLAIDAAVLYLTLRISGLENTMADVRVLPPIPFAGFLALLTFGYVSAFTVAGGQTIGKMIMHLRVIGDDGRPLDPAGGMIRAAGCMLVPLTLGLSYAPALVTNDHRALHDRIAGTRVVRER